MRVTLAAAIALVFATGASAQEPPKCTTVARPPAALAGWATPIDAKAAADASAATAILLPGKAVAATLSPSTALHYAVAPEKEGDANSFGGMFLFEVKQAGTYRIALSAGGWIGVVRNGKAIASSTHSHGPDCSGIRKMVDFALTPGRYTLQIASSRVPKVTTLIALLP